MESGLEDHKMGKIMSFGHSDNSGGNCCRDSVYLCFSDDL